MCNDGGTEEYRYSISFPVDLVEQVSEYFDDGSITDSIRRAVCWAVENPPEDD